MSLNITIIQRKQGYKAIVEDRDAKKAYVCPIFMDTYAQALKVAKEAAPLVGNPSNPIIERKSYV